MSSLYYSRKGKFVEKHKVNINVNDIHVFSQPFSPRGFREIKTLDMLFI